MGKYLSGSMAMCCICSLPERLSRDTYSLNETQNHERETDSKYHFYLLLFTLV